MTPRSCESCAHYFEQPNISGELWKRCGLNLGFVIRERDSTPEPQRPPDRPKCGPDALNWKAKG